MALKHISVATRILNETWEEISNLAAKGNLTDRLDDENLLNIIRSVVKSKTKSYHYVLPTQIVAKLADQSLDCRCIQAGRAGIGSFDARSVADEIIVPFDQKNDRVLGGSPEPYVNKPLRCEEFSGRFRNQQKNKQDWDGLCFVLNKIEEKNDPIFAKLVFEQVLIEIFRLLSDVKVVYPVPIRINIKNSVELLQDFLSEQSGGDRLLALAAALFAVIGKHFNLYDSIKRASITTANGAAGMLADLECISKNDDIVMVVEVKDRILTLNHIKNKIPAIRERRVSEIFFIAQRGVLSAEGDEISKLIEHEYISGHNLYIFNLLDLSKVALALLGEKGRHDFLLEVGNQLDRYSDIIHRRAWAGLLRNI